MFKRIVLYMTEEDAISGMDDVIDPDGSIRNHLQDLIDQLGLQLED